MEGHGRGGCGTIIARAMSMAEDGMGKRKGAGWKRVGKGLPAAFVGGGALWGIWLLLWRSVDLPVVLSGLWCPFLAGWLVWGRGAGLGLSPRVWYRLDLWLLFFGAFLFGVARGVAATGAAILSGRTNSGIIAVPLRVESDLSRLLLILSITASPGTIALLAEGDILYVHCLRIPDGPSLPGVEAVQRLLRALSG
ncbi:Na+/H+ antiporter subunit E [Candidatus Bipolaricaulota sp. J31]